jgi:cell division ATPase FtsA
VSVLEALLGLEGVERGQVSTLEAAAQAIAAKLLEEARRQAKLSKRNLQRIEASLGVKSDG